MFCSTQLTFHPTFLLYLMGLPSVCIKMPKWSISFRTLLNLLQYFKVMVILALSHLGLLKPSEQITESATDSLEEHHHPNPNNYVLVLDRMCPSIVPVPIHVLTAYIKRRLPVVEFGQVLERYTKHASEDTVCYICLEYIEGSHEVREQCNCDHVFHRECLDSWVNQGQLTCPLCRAMLFSPKSERTSCGGNPWTMDRDAYLDRLDFIVR
ncbi:hypothetical protein L3X38_028747 [Prunus dulcis]|uniref:RING-type domain-containing protein n=1 Tax=Prunus dulcis TaxID=3755 RepID=A0AAD4Z1J9_PRUDU|nr:hypothetical protein L3X38_028747 [Prunus dulcis]